MKTCEYASYLQNPAQMWILECIFRNRKKNSIFDNFFIIFSKFCS